MALKRDNEALVCIKQALSIKYNKYLYKYLVDIENKIKTNNPQNSEERNRDIIKIDNKKINQKDEYKNIFKETNNSLYSINDGFLNKREDYESSREIRRDSKEIKDKENEEKILSPPSNHYNMFFKFVYLWFKIIIRHIKRHKSIYFIIPFLIVLYKRKDAIRILKFLLNFIGRMIIIKKN
jgi:hypothetical protein